MKNTARKLTHITKHPKYYLTNGKKTLRKLYSKPVNDLKNKSKKLKHDVERYTARKPLKTLGIVTAVSVFSGFLLGYMAGRK